MIMSQVIALTLGIMNRAARGNGSLGKFLVFPMPFAFQMIIVQFGRLAYGLRDRGAKPEFRVPTVQV